MNSCGIAISTSSEISNLFGDSSSSAESVQGWFHSWPEYYIPAGLNSMNSPYLANLLTIQSAPFFERMIRKRQGFQVTSRSDRTKRNYFFLLPASRSIFFCRFYCRFSLPFLVAVLHDFPVCAKPFLPIHRLTYSPIHPLTGTWEVLTM